MCFVIIFNNDKEKDIQWMTESFANNTYNITYTHYA